jgi:hypothetical protein
MNHVNPGCWLLAAGCWPWHHRRELVLAGSVWAHSASVDLKYADAN